MIIGMSWAKYTLAAYLRPRWAFFLIFFSIPFQTFSVFSLEIAGGATILPVIACASMLTFKFFRYAHHPVLIENSIRNWTRLEVLNALLLVAVDVRTNAPIFFDGITAQANNKIKSSPLLFSFTNIMQIVFPTTPGVEGLCVYPLLVSEAGWKCFAITLLIGGGMCVLSGVFDMTTAGSRTAVYLRDERL